MRGTRRTLTLAGATLAGCALLMASTPAQACGGGRKARCAPPPVAHCGPVGHGGMYGGAYGQPGMYGGGMYGGGYGAPMAYGSGQGMYGSAQTAAFGQPAPMYGATAYGQPAPAYGQPIPGGTPAYGQPIYGGAQPPMYAQPSQPAGRGGLFGRRAGQNMVGQPGFGGQPAYAGQPAFAGAPGVVDPAVSPAGISGGVFGPGNAAPGMPTGVTGGINPAPGIPGAPR